MFVIVHDNTVILGPMRWSKYKFENVILEECEVDTTLPTTNDNLDPITVSDNVKILPVQRTENPDFNPTIEMLHGPFWEFTDTVAIMSYTVQPLPLDAAKAMLKDRVAAERWTKENSGVTVNLNGTDYSFGTDRATRLVLMNAQASTDNINWKQDRDTWVTLTPANVQTVLSTVLAHVQSSFDWEYTKLQAIDACASSEDLAGINITE
jgi:hypothetical protein